MINKIKEFEADLDKHGFDRMRVRLEIENGKLTDVVYQYESFISDKWTPIVRYDCAHGFFHRDELYPTRRKEKVAMEMGSLKDASQYASQDIKDRWEWYKQRYLKHIKK